MPGIPKVIHQIYFGGESAVREDYRRYRETWLTNHPTWTHRFWDAGQCRRLVADHYTWFLPVYDAYAHRVQRCDAVRYFILHRYGGLYVDMDIESLKPVDDLVDACDLLLSENVAGYTNAIMGSVAGHALWPRVYDTMTQRAERPPFSLAKVGQQGTPHYICRSTGPLLLSDCVRDGHFDRQPGVRLCPGYVFEPLATHMENGRPVRGSDTSRSYAIHHMTMHWLPPVNRLADALFQPLAKLFWGVKRLRARFS